MPRLMLNENAIMYGKETQSDVSRQKRAIPLGLIFSGVSAIGGLMHSPFKSICRSGANPENRISTVHFNCSFYLIIVHNVFYC